MMNSKNWDQKKKTGLGIATVCGVAFFTEVIVFFAAPDLWNEFIHNVLLMLCWLGMIYGVMLIVWDDFK
jgi:hypothetical protein